MTLLEQLQAAAENARKGLPAALTIDADGVQYTRNFMPQERLILLGGGRLLPIIRAFRKQSRLYVICFRRQSRKSASERAITLPLSRAGIVMTRTACGSFCAASCRAISA